jgi:hypothetical protein
MTPRRRWDDDDRGIGIADAHAWRPLVDSVAGFTDMAGWVAEEPAAHLLPHLATAIEMGPARIDRTETDTDGTFVVDLVWVGPSEPTRPAVRSVLFELVGTIAETITLVHEPPAGRGRELEVLTGSPDGDSAFAGHGHTLRFRVTVPRE